MGSIIKKTLKVIFWLIIGILLLLMLLPILVRIPSVQRKMTGFAVSYLSGKTHTAVRIDEIAIVFPKSVMVKGLFMGDEQNDTLISAEKIRLNIGFKDLFHKNIHVKSFSLEVATLKLNRPVNDSLFNFNFLLTAFADSLQVKPVKDSVSLWKFAIDKVTLNDTRLQYDDAYDSLSASAIIKSLILKMDEIDLDRSIFEINELVIRESSVLYSDQSSQLSVRADLNELQVKMAALELQGNFKFIAKSIGMVDNSFEYGNRDSVEFPAVFNANYSNFKEVNLEASDIFVTDALKSVSIRHFSGVDQNNFTIKNFETEFSMDQHSITARRLIAETSNSNIDAEVRIEFSSLEALADSIGNIALDLDIKEANLMNSDILYFSKELGKQSFFENETMITSLSGKLSGSLNNLAGKNLLITTGANTTLETDFKITGLPKFQTMQVDFPNLKIKSGKRDIRMMAKQYLPESIDLPESITANIQLKGNLKSFFTNLKVRSTFGNAVISASIDPQENFTAKADIARIDLGRLLKDTLLFGPITGVAEIKGKGLDKNTIHAKIDGEISQLWLKGYNYQNLSMHGNISGQEFDGIIKMKDENADFNFVGLVNINPGQERYKFTLNVEGADLQKLNLSKKGLAVGMLATVDLKGGSLNEINGLAAIRNIVIIQNGKNYVLDSLVVLSINEPQRNKVSVSSALIDVQYTGAVSLVSMPSALVRQLNRYFPFSEVGQESAKSGMPSFNLEMQIHNHPIISEVILPQLKDFEEISLLAGYDTDKQELSGHALIKNLIYGTIDIKDLEAEIKSELNSLKYRVSSHRISNEQVSLDNLLF
jgi:hypothetical protein